MRAKWVLVPSHAIGRMIGERLVREGTNWVNLRCTTPYALALRMAGPALASRGLRPMHPSRGPVIVDECLATLAGRDAITDEPYLRTLYALGSVGASVWRTLAELRMAGIEADALEAAAEIPLEKRRGLAALLRAVDDWLRAAGECDQAMVFAEALAGRGACPVQAGDCWTEVPETVWPPIVQRLLMALPGERILPEVYTQLRPPAQLPRRVAPLAVRRVTADPTQHPLAFLRQEPPADVPLVARHPLPLVAAGGHDAEIEHVVRRILHDTTPLDHVEVVCCLPGQAARVWEKALRYGWPVTVADGLPLVRTSPGRALVGLMAWVEGGCRLETLRRWLRSGDARLSPDEAFHPSDALRLLGGAGVTSGGASYRRALMRVIAECEAARDAAPRKGDAWQREEAALQSARQVLSWMDEVCACVPGFEEQTPDCDPIVSMTALADGLARLVTAHARQRGGDATSLAALDPAAVVAIAEQLGALAAAQSSRLPLSEALARVRAHLDTVSVGASEPMAGALHVTSLTEAGWSGRPAVFVIGLEEGGVFTPSTEDAILLDAERAAVSDQLRRSTDVVQEAVHAALGRLAVAGPAVTLSYSVRDTREARDTYASWVLLHAYRVLAAAPDADYSAMKAAIGAPVSVIPAHREDAPHAAAWWLRSVVGTGEAGTRAVAAIHAESASGVAAAEARAAGGLTVFDGHVPNAGAALDPANGRTVSVTELEQAAECPFRYFLRRGLSIYEPDEEASDEDVWLDARARGQLLHGLYASFWRTTWEGGATEPTAAVAAEVRRRAEAMLDDWAISHPARSLVIEHERAALLRDVDRFLASELEASSRRASGAPAAIGRAVGVEVPFGMPDGDVAAAPTGPDTSDAVTLALHDGATRVTFRGRIDRIEKVSADDPQAPHAYAVVDYKTGRATASQWEGTFKQGRRLQFALYAYVAEQLLRQTDPDAVVTSSMYRFPTERGDATLKVLPRPTVDTLREVVGDIRRAIAEGQFVRTPDPATCKHCQYRLACSVRDVTRAQATLEGGHVAAFARVRDHA